MHLLTYCHTRNLFAGSDFKKWVRKYFNDVEYAGTESGHYRPSILVTNYEDVKEKLPKTYRPVKVQFAVKKFKGESPEIIMLRHLANGNLSGARELGAANQPTNTIGEARKW